MRPTPLGPRAGARFRRTRVTSVELLVERIAVLVAERQELRARRASAEALERNRRRIARSQWELSHALIDRYLPKPPDEQAA